MIRVRVYATTRIAKTKFIEYCENNMDNIKMKRFRARYKVSVVLLKNNDFILFMSDQIYSIWCIGRTYYDDLYQCYRRSDIKISKELAEKFDRC